MQAHFRHLSRALHQAGRRTLLAAACAVALVLGGSPAGAQQMAGSVEDGLAQLARAIAERSKAAELTTIAVLPFPHADGACSVLSTYVVDELILSLFTLSDAGLEIVERSQLEAIIVELAIGEGGLLNPATTKELGNLSGVNALTIGTITVIGDSVRLNARLVATDTGKTISAAAVTVPRTQAVATLLGQPSTCATNITARSGSPNAASSQAGASNLPPKSDYPNQVKEGLLLEVRKAARDQRQTDQAVLVFSMVNFGSETRQVSLNKATYTDNSGNICYEYDDRFTYGKYSGIPLYGKEFLTMETGERLQFIAAAIPCRSATFTGHGTVDVELLLSEGGSKPTQSTRFSIFDVPFEGE